MREHSLIRKIIVFAIFFVALVVIAPTIVFYSLGYRFDKGNNTVIHSGSIVFKTTPANPEISIDNKKIDQASIDLINRSLNINGLEPKNYQVEISTAGYYPWKKNIEVHSGIATEFWNITLVPQDQSVKTITEDNIVKYSFTGDKKKIAYFLNKDNTVSLFIHDFDLGQDTPVYKESLNQRVTPKPGELKWSPDGKWLLFSFKKNNTEEIYLTNIGTGFAELIELEDAWENIAVETLDKTAKNKKVNATSPIKYSWDDQDNIVIVVDNKIYLQSATNILDLWRTQSGVSQETADKKAGQPSKVTFGTEDLPTEIKENVSGFAFCGSYLCSINVSERKLEVADQNGNLKQYVDFPDNYQTTDSYQIFAYAEDRVAILDANENLFLWDEVQNKKEGKEGMKFIFPGVKDVYFSDDGKKLLFSTKNEAYVYFVRDWEVQPKHTVGDLEVIYRDPEELQKVQWYLDYQNVFVADKNGIKLIELDSRGGRNSSDFLKGSALSEVSYDTNAKKLWYLEDQDNGMKKLQEITFPVTTGIFSGIMNSGSNQ